jgi:lipid-A-disaccharide synthase
MKYYIIAGEASGDLHGSNLMKAYIKRICKYSLWGGDLMQKLATSQALSRISFHGFRRSPV